MKAVGGTDREKTEYLSDLVVKKLEEKFHENDIPDVEDVQDLVEKILIEEGHAKTAKAYILYRKSHEELRKVKGLFDTIEAVDDYIGLNDWMIKENSNMGFSLQGLNNYITTKIISNYWVRRIYPEAIRNAHENGDLHIHDLGTLGAYCFDDKTKILTENGWKYFKDVKDGEKVATKNLKTGKLEFQIPYAKQVYGYSGEMYSFEGRNVSLLVTPEHRLLVKRKHKKTWEFVNPPEFKYGMEFDKTASWKGKKPKKFQILNIKGGNRKKHIPYFDIIDYLEFMGWYISEGSVYEPEKGDYRISIAQSEGRYREEIRKLLRRMKLNFNDQSTFNVHLHSKDLFYHLKGIGTSKNKYIPKHIKQMSPDLINKFLISLFKGDGSLTKDGKLRKYFTSSQRLAEDVIECLLKINLCGTLSKRRGGGFVVNVEHKHLTPTYRNKVLKKKYKGRVYDFSVPNNILIVMREGKVVISGNCVGWDLKDLLMTGFRGVTGKISSKPPKHLGTAIGQIINFFYTLQGESAGAQAFSNFDTLLAPFVRYDNLDYNAVKQAMQGFLFNLSVPTRVGFQNPFTNITMDLKVPDYMKNEAVIIGGQPQNKTYEGFENEMAMINRAFAEGMLDGDAEGRVFTFPIPTYNITKDFDWDNQDYKPIWEMTAKYGIPYFSNFINSDMKPEDSRSMCCRLRLNQTELRKRGGGLFGANPQTGCYDDKTEILTENGWKFFEDLNKSEKVFTLSNKNKIELRKPKKHFEYKYNGQLIRFKNRMLDLLVTPNHRMVVDQVGSKKRKFVEAQNLDINNQRIPKGGFWEGKEEKWFILPGIKYTKFGRQGRTPYSVIKESLKIEMNAWLKFFGFWLAEGCFDNEKISKRHGYRVIITQVNKKNKDEFRKILDALPFSYHEEKNNFVICNKQLWSYLKQFGKKDNKFIPLEIKKLSKSQINIMFDWMVKGDGHVRKTNGQINYWTCSKKLADDIQEIVLKLGLNASITIQNEKTSIINGRKVNANKIYVIGVQRFKHYRLRKGNISIESYKGKVYCCEVENNTVFVRRNGKTCWCGNSIGVVTINMPRLGFTSVDEQVFFEKLESLMELAKESLEIKRKAIERFTELGLYPYSRFYLRNVKERFGQYWKNHFSTIGLLGMNEAISNFMPGENIGTKNGKDFTIKVLNFMRHKLEEYQQETGNIYNLEATPGEGTTYRFARNDKKRYGRIIVANEIAVRDKTAHPYYTNSTQLPVNYTTDMFKALELQDDFQILYTGGTVFHGFIGEKLPKEGIKLLVRKIAENFHLPYFTLTPTFSICPIHGYLSGDHEYCPKCDKEIGYIPEQ